MVVGGKMKDVKIPTHVAIILDGNRRWAKSHLLPKLEGHRRGFSNIKKIADYIFKKGVKYLSVYCFSTENFRREASEVDYLMNLFIKEFKDSCQELKENNIKVVFSGRKKPLRDDVLKAMDYLKEETKLCTGGILNICLNYGGQSEIVDAAKSFARSVLNGTDINSLDEKGFYKYLYQDLPPIDFLIRTSGEVRISNFMLYSLAYAEMYFPDVYFPDFNEEEIDKAIFKYNSRDRRFGGIKNEKKSS